MCSLQSRNIDDRLRIRSLRRFRSRGLRCLLMLDFIFYFLFHFLCCTVIMCTFVCKGCHAFFLRCFWLRSCLADTPYPILFSNSRAVVWVQPGLYIVYDFPSSFFLNRRIIDSWTNQPKKSSQLPCSDKGQYTAIQNRMQV